MLRTGTILCFFLCFVGSLSLKATHNRAGEIMYKRIEPFAKVENGITVPVYTYSITLIKYTDHGSQIADRCVDTIYFGDGQRGIAPRINGLTTPCNCSFGTNILGCGEIIINEKNPDFVVKRNVYTIIHTYPGPGSYLIRTFDPMRNKGVHNIPLSDERPFYVESLLIITSFSGANSSPVFKYAPIDRACVGDCFEHNPGAYDPDGTDSLSFEITTSRGQDGQTVTGYFFPETGPGGTYGINPKTGLLRWCVPQFQDEYNIAFIVKEWRKNTSGQYQLIGYVLRDMQVIVRNCLNNKAPVLTVPADICVEAGEKVSENILFSDPNDGQIVKIEGEGGAFEAVFPQATLSPTIATTFTSVGTYTANFTWQTTCEHVRQQGYETHFKASDNFSIAGVSFRSFNIKVVPPSVKNVTATPAGSNMRISWSLSTCNPVGNPLINYKIYRKDDCSPFIHDPCQTGVPTTSGFTFIGETNSSTSVFVDNNQGKGLVVGQNYSYIVVAVYRDGTVTFGSATICSMLKRDIPVILNVDVRSTSTSSGTVRVRWAMPVVSDENLDTIAFKGPYRFNLKHRTVGNGSYTTVFTSTNNYFLPYFNMGKDSTDHSGLNTAVEKHEYLVEFIAGTVTIGASQKAASVFLNAIPSDRKIDLSWEASTPWINKIYHIWRKDPGSAAYVKIGSSTQTSFNDTSGIANRSTYCYFVQTEGAYSDPLILKPLFNNSQETCAKAVDQTPPCAPTLSVEAVCPTGFVNILWDDIRNNKCGDDVVEYILYYKPTPDAPFVEVTRGLKTSFVYDGLDLISGCYAVAAIDSSGNKSPLSADFCMDNCPEFELPNIFSPNNDGVNDHFMAIKVRQIKEIDLIVVDRWGNLVYKTKDPFFKWDGISIITKQAISDGTLFYVCDVFEPRLQGIIKRNLKGTVQLVR